MTKANALLHEALQLPTRERAKLAGELIASLDDEDESFEPVSDEEWAASWGAEIGRRLKSLEDGTSGTVAWEEVRAQALARLEDK